MNEPQPSRQTPGRIVTVVLSYAAFASLWILLSDRAVGLLFSDPARITLVSTLKGWAFVVVTSLLLYGLMRRPSGAADTPDVPPGNIRTLLVPVGLLSTAILALTAGGIGERLSHQKQIEVARLQVIADLKTRQIVDWLKERQDDARFVQTSPLFADCYRRWREDGNMASRELLQAQIAEFGKSHGLAGTMLLDERGETLWDSQGPARHTDPGLRAAALQAAADRRVTRLGPYRDAAGGMRLDFIAPLTLGGDPPLVVMSVDPAEVFYPHLQSWPVPSRSGEALLFKRDGEQVVFLNQLRHRPDPALTLRISLAAKDLPAAKMLRGEVGPGELLEGVDYRGVPIVGIMRAVPGTEWFLGAKVDKAELYADAAADAFWIALAGLLALCGATTGAFLLLQRRQLTATLNERQAQEEKLRALQLLEAISEGSNDAIFAKDLEGRYLFFNREAARITGKPPEQVLGRDDSVLFPPAEADLLMAIGRQVVAEDRTVTNEEVLTTATGTSTFLATKGPLHDAAGRVIGHYGISRDITARKTVENALRDREERLRLALQAAGQGLYDLNVQTGEAVVSPEYALMLGYDPAEFHETNAAWIERLHPDDRETVAAVYRDYVRGLLPEYRVEFRQRTRSGDWKWILSLGKLVEHDDQGRPLRMLGTHTDITARKNAEEALRENEALTRAVLDNLPIGIAVNSVDPAVAIYMNDNFPLFYRTTREKLAAPDAFWDAAYEDPEFREQIRKRVLEDCASGDPQRMYWVDVPITRRGEETYFITARNTLVPGKTLVISTVWDVTERKRAEEEKTRLEAQLLQAQKMELVGRLAGGVAHDFNNMLFVILGHAAIALERTDPAQPLHADLEEIRKAAQRSADLTRQLLAFARRQAVAPRVLDLNAAVSGLLSMLRRLIGEDIELDWRPGESLWPVRIDPAQLDQILANLCVNSRDAIAGTGKITIATDNASFDEDDCTDRPGCVPGEYVLLAVSDDGCGMGEEVRSHLFEPFYTTKEAGRGTGLGLATVYGIVKQNDGFIDVSSEPQQGTAIRIYLRRCAGTVVEASAEPLAEMPLGRGETVLLVEDEASILNLGTAMLERLGYAVLCAGTAGEAMRLAREHAGAIRLLVTDVIMPELNGRDLARLLRAGNPEMKCLFMSGYTADVIAHHGVLDENVRFIQKPFSLHDLAFKVSEALAGGGTRGLRVLCVDDEVPLLELIRRYLERHGCVVSGYADPAAALAEFRRDPRAYDYVVTDLAMPGMTGFELAREMLALRADIPIVMTSGYVKPEDEREARALGALALIQKPGTFEELGARLVALFRSGEPTGAAARPEGLSHLRRRRAHLDITATRGEDSPPMTTPDLREIRFNYTSADDRQVVTLLLGAEGWSAIERLRARRVTGRLARLLMRVLGEIFIHRRNPFLVEELVLDPKRRRHLFGNLADDLALIGRQSGGDQIMPEVLGRANALLEAFRREVTGLPAERERIRRSLGAIVGATNVLFDPFTLVSHATDATDWRLFLPAAVALPTGEGQVQPLLAAIAALGLHAIPRGAGTGLTGGAVPLRSGCVVVNTERLDRIRGIEERPFTLSDGRTVRAHVMSLEAGVVTERAMEAASGRGLNFATDPTSAWACTIGGNIAENAGGKTAVRYGTCIDNLLAWSVAMPGGSFTVRRLDHPLRKILPGDTVRWRVEDGAGREVRTIALAAGEIRKPGLWKDITNKALGGVPGLQKEGTDGVITSAEFILHPQYAAAATLCLEFFGDDMDEASEVILELVRAFPDEGAEALEALEHFDGQYVRAIDYRVKAARAGTPKAVLLIDVVGHDDPQLKRAVAKIGAILERHANTEIAVARDAAEAKLFWADRKRLGAIAARTNAFKLNEDIVLPLEALAEFSRWVDGVNLEEERENLRELARRLRDFFEEAPSQEDPQWLGGKLARALDLCEEALEALSWEDASEMRGGSAVEGLLAALRELARGYPEVAAGIEGIVRHVRSRLVVLATHMHAGDGNVHVNIPVMSNDRAMLHRAEIAVDRLMEKAAALGGVCSGEHGIGVTKLKYLDPALRAALAAYRRTVDPGGVMNPGKLDDLAALELIFTPSFNLLELEARILRHGQLEELALKIAHCVRCGKCKPDCCVFYPAGGLFYHPRNKNLAIGALIEALLYDAQRERGGAFELLRNLEQVADHCTLCHKCLKPCPVGIDTGEVSVLERDILAVHEFKRTAPATRVALAYLESVSPAANRLFRAVVLGAGGAAQRLVSRAVRPLQGATSAGRGSLFGSPMPPPDPLGLRDVLPRCEADQALVFEPDGAARATVFYFPGCGSERLYGSVGLAALHLLLERGARVVLPPPYLCCGFPAYATARTEMHGRISLRDAILFAQIREMFSHLAFDAVAVTCGTCREAIAALEVGKVFGCAVADAARLALDLGAPVAIKGDFLYHAPCHDSLDGRGATLLATAGATVGVVPHCCSEAGTLALSRPDITGAMLHRKRAALAEARAGQPGGAVLLTNCPSCLTGLGRNRDLGIEPRHIAVELALALSGPGWLEKLRERVRTAQPVRF